MTNCNFDDYNNCCEKDSALLFIFSPNIINAFGMNWRHSSHFFDNFDIRWNIGIIGYEQNLQGGSDMVFLGFPNFRLMHNHTRIGLEFTPVKMWDWLDDDDGSVSRISYSFLNFGVFWNMLNFSGDRFNIFVDPFSRINYINLDDRNRLNWNSFVYTAGFRAGLITGQFDGSVNGFWDSYSITVVGAEIGFRNINGSNTFFSVCTQIS